MSEIEQNYEKLLENMRIVTEKMAKQSPAQAMGARFEIKNTKAGVEFSVSANIPEYTVKLYKAFRQMLLNEKVIKRFGLKL